MTLLLIFISCVFLGLSYKLRLSYKLGYHHGRNDTLSYLRKVIPNVDVLLESEENRESYGYSPRV